MTIIGWIQIILYGAIIVALESRSVVYDPRLQRRAHLPFTGASAG